MIDSKGHGARIRQALLDHNALLGQRALAEGRPVIRYTDRQFAHDVGMAERGKPYANTTGADWISERNEPDLAVFLAMEVVLERPGIAVWLAFNIWTAEGKATPGAVKSAAPREAFADPRKKRKPAKKATASGGGRRKRRER